MPDIPKIVRSRLETPLPVSGRHPDPDILTAFAEQCLTPRERSTVLEHVSRCADCREVLALALPEIEALQPKLQPSRATKLTWPVIRWAFVSAAGLTLAILGYVEYGHRTESLRMAKNAPPAAVQTYVQPQPATPPQDQDQLQPSEKLAASFSKATAGGVQAEKDTKHLAEARKAEVARNFTVSGARGSLAHGPRQANQWQQNTSALQTQAQGESKQAAAPEMAKLAGANVAPSAIQDLSSPSAPPSVQSLDSVVARNEPGSPRPVPPSSSDVEVSRAKAATASGLTVNQPAVRDLRATNANWTITSGRLQRSLDGGLTWQDVNVAALANEGASMQLAVAARKSARQSEKRDKKVQADASVFRAVAANGPEVWAGANDAALYHSTDAGAHWVRVTPSSSSSILTGDIVSLDFPDTQNGRLATSTGEVWTTADNGRSWQKQ